MYATSPGQLDQTTDRLASSALSLIPWDLTIPYKEIPDYLRFLTRLAIQ